MSAWIGYTFESQVPSAYFSANDGNYAETILRNLTNLADTLGYIRVKDPILLDRDKEPRGLLSSRVLTTFLGYHLRGTGIVQSVSSRYDEPYHSALSVAMLDYSSLGSAGIYLDQRSNEATDRAFDFGAVSEEEKGEQLAEFISVLRSLWNGWQADAIIRDTKTYRYIDRSRVRASNFKGRHFQIGGPTTTPRPLQGLPPIFISVDGWPINEAALAAADVIILPGADVGKLRRLVRDIDDILAERGGRRDRRLVAGFSSDDLSGGSEVNVAAIRQRLEDTQDFSYLRELRLDGIDVTFPIESVLQSPAGNRPSEAWRSPSLRQRLGFQLPTAADALQLQGNSAR